MTMMNRRDFLKLIAGVPVLGGLALVASPLLRYLRPSTTPLADTRINTQGPITEWQGSGGLFSPPDAPEREKDVVFSLSDFPTPWSSKEFTFGQRSKEYTFRHFQATKLPGFAVRLPEDQPNGQPNFIIVNRICPHMGCVFNFITNPADMAAYNYPQATHPYFACPCHLSVYDPLQTQDIGGGVAPLGKVVSGPAPRPPRSFVWKIEGDKLLITEAEAGGIS
ncbi:MAG: ubiquinol-cytochrome c reductase iron-sulfur subunit [Candidatus Melainabacteria bacterium]